MEANNKPVGTTSRRVLITVDCDCDTSANPVPCWEEPCNVKGPFQVPMSTKGLPSRRVLPILSLSLLVGLCGCATKTAESFLPAVREERPPNTARIYAHAGFVYPYYWIDWGEGAPRNAIIKAYSRIPVLHYTIPADSDLEETCIQAVSGKPNVSWGAGAHQTVGFKEFVADTALYIEGDSSNTYISVPPQSGELAGSMVTGHMIDGVWIIGGIWTQEIPLIRSRHASMTNVWREEYILRDNQRSITVSVQGEGSSADDGSSTGWKAVSTLADTSRAKWVSRRARSNQAQTQCRAIAYELQRAAPTSGRECGVFVFHHEALQQSLPKERGAPRPTAHFTNTEEEVLIALRKLDGTTQVLGETYPELFVLAAQQDDPLWEWPFISREEIAEILTDGEAALDACIIGRIGFGGTVVYDRPPGMVDLDVFATQGGAVAYFTIPVKFHVEAGKTYHITSKYGYKYEVREEP